MRVIVLGHRGFVGSAIRERFAAAGAEVIGVDRENYASLRGMRADVLVNANGSSDRRLARAQPLASFRANVATAMDSLADFDCAKYVLLSSVEVYNDLTDIHATAENAAIDPGRLEPYGLFKWMTELAVRTQARAWLILRLAAMVGPGLWKNAVFDILHRGTLYVHPSSELPFMDTREVARAAWDLIGEDREIYNVCGDGSIRLRDIATALGIPLAPDLDTLPRETVHVDVAKLRSRRPVPASMDAVIAFAREAR